MDRQKRFAFVKEARARGESFRAIGKQIGVSPNRARQIAELTKAPGSSLRESRVLNALAKEGISPDDTPHISDEDLLRIDNFGRGSLEWLRAEYPPSHTPATSHFTGDDVDLLYEVQSVLFKQAAKTGDYALHTEVGRLAEKVARAAGVSF